MNEPQLLNLVCGLLGGMVRAAVGLTKYFRQTEGQGKIQFGYLGFSLITAVLAGGVAGLLANDWRLSILLGYAGTDFLENAYKILVKGKLNIQKTYINGYGGKEYESNT